MLRRIALAWAALALLAAPAPAATRFLPRTALGGGQATFVLSAPTLAALGLSPTTVTAGVGYSGTITGRTAGSSLTATSSDLTALIVSGTTVTGTFAAAGSPTVSVVETLAGATGSPRTSTFTFSVAASGGFAPALDLSDDRNSQYLGIL